MAPTWPIPVQPLAPVACGSVLWRRGAAEGVSIVVKATFGLVPESVARLVAPADIAREDRYRAGGCLEEASELAPYLPSAGVILAGMAHAPPGQPSQALSVRLGVFRDRPLLNKVLHVFGHRSREAPASAQPFDSMPVVYERAFGGPGVEDNPVGTGAAAGSPLPNVVDPQSHERPAGFGPVARHWGARRRLLGAAQEPPPGAYPESLDWHWFHAAPADQQIEFLQGNEWIALDAMHPTVPHFRTRLPDARAVARWHLVGPAGAGPSRMLSLSADTLVITPESRLCSLIWRGRVLIDHAEAARMQVVVGVEMAGYPLAPAFHAAPIAAEQRSESSAAEEEAPGLEAATERIVVGKIGGVAPRSAGGEAPPQAPLGGTVTQVTSPFASPLPFTKGPALPPPVPPSPRIEPSRKLGNTRTEVSNPFPVLPFGAGAARAPDDEGSTRVLDLDALSPRAPDDEGSTRMIDLDALSAKAIAPFALAAPGARSEHAGEAIPGAPWSPHADPPPAVEEEPVTLSEEPSPIPRPAPAPPPPPEPVAPPRLAPPIATAPMAAAPAPAQASNAPEDPPATPPPPAPATGIRAAVLARVAARESLQDLALAAADLADLDLSGAQLARANLQGTKLARCKLANARLAGAQLADADLSSADLSGADLGGADLSRARLGGARFDGAILTDATLVSAEGVGASFVGASALRANFARGSWEEASFARADAANADFTGASLADARFEGATLSEARFDDARAAGAIFDEARLGRARAVGATLSGARLAAVDAAGSLWERAVLDGASFAGANLKDANLSRATCVGASFASADLSGANLQRTTGDRADLSGARLTGADLRQAKLHDASFARAVLRDVAGGKADLAGCRFVRANLQGAMLRGARLGGASFAHADLEGADLRDADLEGANVFGASRKTAKLGAGVKGLVEVDPGEQEGGVG